MALLYAHVVCLCSVRSVSVARCPSHCHFLLHLNMFSLTIIMSTHLFVQSVFLFLRNHFLFYSVQFFCLPSSAVSTDASVYLSLMVVCIPGRVTRSHSHATLRERRPHENLNYSSPSMPEGCTRSQGLVFDTLCIEWRRTITSCVECGSLRWLILALTMISRRAKVSLRKRLNGVGEVRRFGGSSGLHVKVLAARG